MKACPRQRAVCLKRISRAEEYLFKVNVEVAQSPAGAALWQTGFGSGDSRKTSFGMTRRRAPRCATDAVMTHRNGRMSSGKAPSGNRNLFIGARDTIHNNAVALEQYLGRRAGT